MDRTAKPKLFTCRAELGTDQYDCWFRDGDRDEIPLRAFAKLLWIKNDLINRHFQVTDDHV